MDACVAVEREVDNVLSKFGDIQKNFNELLQPLIENFEMLKNDWDTRNIDDGKFSILSCN